jgi:hypothetical protein
MAPRKLSPEKIRELRTFAAEWGKIVARRAFGDDGPGLDVDFQTMEEIAAAAAAGLTEGTLSTLLERQASSLPAEQPCPACGRRCQVKHEDRPVAVPNSELTYHEPICHCPTCRRDFFPPPHRPRA